MDQYTTFDSKGRWRKQFRGSGKSHGGITRPNIKERKWSRYKGKRFQKKPSVRKPFKREYPRGY
ncbi:hypothetical protein [Desmospora profundinema]|uniref:hypothetical protein n=1 Tax=Desmospora profundinema TaxID=1571184 RepID=UPI0035B56674